MCEQNHFYTKTSSCAINNRMINGSFVEHNQEKVISNEISRLIVVLFQKFMLMNSAELPCPLMVI